MRVERQTLGADAWVEVGDVAADRRFVIDATAAPGETYAYRVQAVSGTEVSAAASPPGFVTLPSVDPPDDTDEDGDGVPDVVELVVGLNPDATDTDGDGARLVDPPTYDTEKYAWSTVIWFINPAHVPDDYFTETTISREVSLPEFLRWPTVIRGDCGADEGFALNV